MQAEAPAAGWNSASFSGIDGVAALGLGVDLLGVSCSDQVLLLNGRFCPFEDEFSFVFLVQSP